MLTPSFNITQDEQFVIVTIRVPYVKISEAEFYINGCEFKFYCKPYFLRLHLPGELVEDGREKAVFDVEAGAMIVHLPKLHQGKHFKNLDMLTTLLSKKPSKFNKDEKPLIEATGEAEDGSDGSEYEFDWETEQLLPEEEQPSLASPLTPNSSSYGFANQHKGVFSKLQEEIPSIVDCPDPDHMTSHERRLARIAHEELSFDPDHYLADLMDNDSIDTLLKYEPSWKEEMNKWKEAKSEASQQDGACSRPKLLEAGQDILSFSQSERDKLKDLPNKNYLLDKATARCLYLGLIDIIFAFAYDHRTTEGEGNVESAWTICKLSPTLSWLEVYRGSVHDVVHSCLRHSLCYPLYRYWQLSLTVLQDTRDIFRLGRRKLLQCLLSVRHSLTSSDPYYILNNLYLTDYCVWVQKASTRQIQSLADDLDEVTVTKESMGWELEELETAAHLVLKGDVKTNDSESESEVSTSATDDGHSASDTSSVDSDDESDGGIKGDNETNSVKKMTKSEPNCSTADSFLTSTSVCSDTVHDPDAPSGHASNEQCECIDEERGEELTLISAKEDCQPGILEQLLNLSIHNESKSKEPSD